MKFPALDSIRGLAALIVVFWHASLVLVLPEGLPAWVMHSPLKLLIAGPPAVMLFFVISGFVLSITFIYRDGEHYAPYLVKRISRIWLPFAAVIVLSAAASAMLRDIKVPDTSHWFNWTWGIGATLPNIVSHLLMTGTASDLDNAMWTLWHEMRISLVFPLLVWASLRAWKTTLAASLVVALCVVKCHSMFDEFSMVGSLITTLTYVFLFVIGIALAMHHRLLSLVLRRQTPLTHTLLWLFALALLAAPFDGHLGMKSIRGDFIPGALMPGLGAALVITLAFGEGPVLTALLGRLPQYLGRISYSLYLTHIVVLAIFVRLFHEALGLQGALIAAVAIAFPIAHLCNRYIEMPAKDLGRYVARRLQQPKVTASTPPH